VPRVVEDLKTKKAWFEANQARVTAENVKKAESEIQRLTNTAKADIAIPSNEAEAESTSTSQVDAMEKSDDASEQSPEGGESESS